MFLPAAQLCVERAGLTKRHFILDRCPNPLTPLLAYHRHDERVNAAVALFFPRRRVVWTNVHGSKGREISQSKDPRVYLWIFVCPSKQKTCAKPSNASSAKN
jgi:hypothetical protein